MERTLSRFGGWRLQYILVIGFVLTTAITLAVGFEVTRTLINDYLRQAEQERVSRDMDLARAFYELKLGDISSMADRLARGDGTRAGLEPADQGDAQAVVAVDKAIDLELSALTLTTQRFVVALNADGRAVVGRICCRNGRARLAVPHADWSELPIVRSVLERRQSLSATEVIPAEVLRWANLDEQAYIPLKDTPKAAPQPFDPREGTAGLAVISVVPVISTDDRLAGAILVGHLFNNDFTLVDRIKEVAGVDTATIFLGDQRVSTNVRDASGNRAIGTRVSQEVYDTVLVKGDEYTGPAYVVDQWYISRYQPLYDHSGEIVGILYVGARQAAYQQLVDSFQRRVLLIAGAMLLLAVAIAVPVAWFVIRPLTSLATATRKVAQGDWSVRVPTNGPRETTILAETFNTMVETLKSTRDQLVQREKLASVGQLAAGVAHEINNPLGSVLLYADILRKDTPEDNVQQRQDLELIMKEATRCKTIVTDLLNFSRQNEVMAQETDLDALLRELVEEVGKKELYRGISVQLDLDPELPDIQADPLQLHQVFLNLMNNSAEAMPDGGQLTLRTRKSSMQGYVTVEVQDTGVGIPPENLKRLFTPFFTTKPIGKGTGLGLAIIYGIVKMHQGQISVRSEVGQGTTFTVSLREELPSLSPSMQTML